jgi:hypothetical protein
MHLIRARVARTRATKLRRLENGQRREWVRRQSLIEAATF